MSWFLIKLDKVSWGAAIIGKMSLLSTFMTSTTLKGIRRDIRFVVCPRDIPRGLKKGFLLILWRGLLGVGNVGAVEEEGAIACILRASCASTL